MKKEVLYTYLGTNGVITTPVHLEGIQSVKKIKLIADDGKILTKESRTEKIVIVPEDEVSDWTEVVGQN